MKTKLRLVPAWAWALVLLCGLAAFSAGCTTEADALQAAEIYTQSLAAMEQANAYAFAMEITQVVQFPEPITLETGVMSNTMETQISSTGKATQKPLAMEMTMQIHIPALEGVPTASELATMEMEMYIADDQLYMFNPMLGGWLQQDLGEYGLGMVQLSELNQTANDPMYLFTLLGDEGAAKASLTTEGQHYLISLTDDDGTLMNKLMGEIIGQFAGDLLDPSMQAEMEERLNDLGFSNLEYKIWLDQDTYLATKIYLAFDLTMTIEEETLTFEQVATGTYKDYGVFDSITVPEEVKNSAISMEELLQNMIMPEQ